MARVLWVIQRLPPPGVCEHVRACMLLTCVCVRACVHAVVRACAHARTRVRSEGEGRERKHLTELFNPTPT